MRLLVSLNNIAQNRKIYFTTIVERKPFAEGYLGSHRDLLWRVMKFMVPNEYVADSERQIERD